MLGKNIIKECPKGLITDWSRETIDLFHLCYAVSPSLGGPAIIPGPLPSTGGILDQDNATMEAFEVIKQEMIEMMVAKGKKKN